MTPQEIDRIQNAINHIRTSSDVDEWAMDIAVEAMEKQIPKKPKQKKRAEEQPLKGHVVYVIPCGNCGEALNRLHDYCPWCGQKIDWSEGEG